MSRTNFTLGGSAKFFLTSSPHRAVCEARWVRTRSEVGPSGSERWRIEEFRSCRQKLRRGTRSVVQPSGLCWQPGFYLRLEAYGFMGLSEGDLSGRRDSVPRGG